MVRLGRNTAGGAISETTLFESRGQVRELSHQSDRIQTRRIKIMVTFFEKARQNSTPASPQNVQKSFLLETVSLFGVVRVWFCVLWLCL